MRRRLLFILAALAAALLAVIATLPLWLGAVVGWAGGSQGITFRSYERLGYSRFALHDVEFKRFGVRVAASRVEASTPALWTWRHWRGKPDAISAGRWTVEVEPRTPSSGPKKDSGWVPLRATLDKIVRQLARWLPQAEAGAGQVKWPGGELALTSARWAERELTVSGLNYRTLTADGTARFTPATDSIHVALRSSTEPASVSLESRGAAVAGEGVWLGQHAPLSARFAPTGWLPAEATLAAVDWRIPGERLRLDAAYAAVVGGAKLAWTDRQITADVHIHGEPVAGKPAPPLEVTLKGQGTPDQFTVETLRASVPGVNAQLTQPVTVGRTGKISGQTVARFAVHVDLAQQPWFTSTGVADGEAWLASDLGASPVIEFRMRAADVSARDVALASVEAKGRFQWPRLEVVSATIVATEGERLEVRGGWDFRTKTGDDIVVEGRIRRQSVARWLPAQPAFDVVMIDARAAGPLAAIEHRGHLRASDVKVNGVNPFAVAVEWRGRGPTAESFAGTVTSGAMQLRAGGSASADGVQLEQLALTRENTPLLRLAAPVSLKWKPNLQLDELHLTGPDAKLDASVTWGKSGRIQATAVNLPSAWLADLMPLKGPVWKVEMFAFNGTWDRAPMTYALTARATVDLGEQRHATVVVSTRGDGKGLKIEALRAMEGDATVLNAIGQLPFTLQPGGPQLFHIDEKGGLALDANVEPNSALWPKLAAATGVELKEPKAELHLVGTWQRPEGKVELNARRVAFDPKRIKQAIPAIEALDVRLEADRGGMNLSTFTVKVEGQMVRAKGRVPVPDEGWGDLFKAPVAMLEKNAELHLEVPDAEVAVFTRFLPAVLAPQGRLAVDVKFDRGQLSGFAQLRDAASRPLGPLGVLQEINAEVGLAGRTITLRSLTAKSGGQPVVLTGTVEVPAGAAPRYDLALRGENLPFVRQTGLLLRGDLDLKLQSPREGAPRITGNVRLRDSLFLQDVRAFLPRGGGGGAARRPPYFSVETPPLNAWALAIEVTGVEFMRLRTPVFNGLASAHFRLGGTLGEPRALGEVNIEEGHVRMPFASFDVKQGSVRLTEANPYEPEIYLRGTSRRYGYDVTMEIEGAASGPNVVFTSSPALESEQVLLMIMTGAAPSNEITNSGTRRVAQFGAFLGQSLLGSLGADSANAERLSIASGEKISRQGKETYEVEYKLSERWTATGEYNEYDEYNAGLKWRMLPRPKPEEVEKGKANARK